LIFVRAGASFRHETRKAATSPLALRANRVRLTFDGYVLDVARRELWRGAEPIAVEPQVFDLLVYPAQSGVALHSDDICVEGAGCPTPEPYRPVWTQPLCFEEFRGGALAVTGNCARFSTIIRTLTSVAEAV
jgi:hypothetical protein